MRSPKVENLENQKYFLQMEAIRKEKRAKYEQEAYRKVKESRRELPNNTDYFSERDRK
jgi:hypothetical protein